MIYLFDYKGELLLSEIGGKGKALIETYRADFPVPNGLVLSVDFFQTWISNIKSSREWEDLLDNPSLETCNRVQELALKQTFDSNMAAKLIEEVVKLGDDLLAVRSSSPEEDLEGLSFAGMYETFLGVTSEKLESAVIKAFSSCFSYRVVSYKTKHNIDLKNTKIAVIIQRQIASVKSGIGFSLNPMNNAYDEVLINASFGLGESIVSGIITPDLYIFDNFNSIIKDKTLGEKSKAVYLNDEGSTETIDIQRSGEQVLNDEEIRELSAMIKKCENYYGFPVDIEWAYDEEGLYLLQSRPITTYFPLYPELKTEIGERKKLYFDLIKSSQGFEWSMSTLGGELFAELIDIAKQGVMPVGVDGVIYCLHGRMYLMIGNISKVFGKRNVPKLLSNYESNSAKLLEKINLEEYIPDKKPKLLKGIIGHSVKSGFKIIGSALGASFNFKGVIDEYYETVESWSIELEKMRGSTRLFTEQVDYIYGMYNELILEIMSFSVSMLAPTILNQMFKGKDVKDDLLALGMDFKGNPTSEMGYHQLELASFQEFIHCDSYDSFKTNLEEEKFSTEFLDSYKEYMRKFGCRGIGEVDIERPRIHENIEELFDLLKQINIEDNAIINSRKKKKEAYNRLLDLAKEMGKEKKFIKQASRMEWFGIREHPKYMYVCAVDILRHNVLIIAEKFVSEERLSSVEDIFYLSRFDISKSQMDSKFNLSKIVEEEKKIRKLNKKVKSWPMMFDSRGKIFTHKINIDDGAIKGESVSPGIVKGRAKVLHEPFEKKLEKGEILVVVSTEPSWTPIFINASGVVMEIGGSLQHGAIIAREYGIPCVTGIQNATQIIKDGDLIEVDGSNGIIRIIEEED